MLQKIDNCENLTEKELSTLVYEYEVETSHGENRRWSRTNTTIVKIKDRFFSIDWEQGLTEVQEDEFYNQPFEVEKRTYDKVIKVIEWARVKK